MATLNMTLSKLIAPGARLRALLLLPLGAACYALHRLYDASLSPGQYAALIPLRCPFKWLLGIDCPTCGLGRSLVAAVLGHWSESLRYHPLGLPLLSLFLLIFFAWIIDSRHLGLRLQKAAHFAKDHRYLSLLLLFAYILWGFTRPWHSPIPL